LGVVIDAAGASKGIAALKDADKQATKTYSSLQNLSKGFKIGLADKFKSELKDVEKLSRTSAIGQQLGRTVGTGATEGFSSVFNAKTLGSLIGTVLLPGVGTAIGSTIGSGVDAVLSKVSGPVMAMIEQGIDLNKQLEIAKVHFTAFTGSEKEAAAHLEELKKLSVTSGLDLPQLLKADQRLEEFNGNVQMSALELRAAADASRAFYGDATGFNAIADALGLIAEKGELTGKTLMKLQRQGVNATKYLSEALGLNEKKVKELIAKGRIRGDGAAQMIAEGIEVHKRDTAASIVNNTVAGMEDRQAALKALLSQQGTVAPFGAYKDYLGVSNNVLGSSGAQQVVEFINSTAGRIIAAVENSVSAGVNFTKGVAQGVGSGEAVSAIKNAISSVANTALTDLKGAWDIQSPSGVTEREIGVPISQGIGVGFVKDFETVTKPLIIDKLESLLEDPRVKAFLAVIRASELGFKEKHPYSRAFGHGGHIDPATLKADGSNWYGERVYSPTLHRSVQTHAFGGYQAEPGTYRGFARATGVRDVLPHEQDLFAVWDILKKHPQAMQAILSGDSGRAMNLLKPEWESFAVNSPHKAAALKNLFASNVAGGSNVAPAFSVNNAPVSNTNPMPVIVAAGLSITAKLPGSDTFNPEGARRIFSQFSNVFKETTDAVKAPLEQLPLITRTVDQTLAMLPPALYHAAEATAAYSKSAEDARKAYITGASKMDQAMGALSSVAGLLPSGGGQVGKKRGLFSKILGFAAPFLSFLPGGGVLSALAGMGSKALVGDWQGVVSGAAAGFSTGGAFRSHGSSNGAQLGDMTVSGKLASGGPVRKGRAYLVGDGGRTEVFTPDEDGFVHSSVDSFARSRGGSGSSRHGGPWGHLRELMEQQVAATHRQAAATEALHAKITSVPPDHLLTAGARTATGQRALTSGFLEGAARDPKVYERLQRQVAPQ
jgi:hypothetical protein